MRWQVVEQALFGFARYDNLPGRTAGHDPVEAGEVQIAPRLLSVVAGQTVLTQDRLDVLVVADLVRRAQHRTMRTHHPHGGQSTESKRHLESPRSRPD